MIKRSRIVLIVPVVALIVSILALWNSWRVNKVPEIRLQLSVGSPEIQFGSNETTWEIEPPTRALLDLYNLVHADRILGGQEKILNEIMLLDYELSSIRVRVLIHMSVANTGKLDATLKRAAIVIRGVPGRKDTLEVPLVTSNEIINQGEVLALGGDPYVWELTDDESREILTRYAIVAIFDELHQANLRRPEEAGLIATDAGTSYAEILKQITAAFPIHFAFEGTTMLMLYDRSEFSVSLRVWDHLGRMFEKAADIQLGAF